MTRLAVGRCAPVRHLHLNSGDRVDLADARAITHLQFRRFAGCPVCDLHLQEFIRRRAEIEPLLREIIIFHSRREELVSYSADIPFPLVADPTKRLYTAYGVEGGHWALLHPRAWPIIARAVLAALPGIIFKHKPMPPLFPPGGRYGLPADFLISPAGSVIAAHYGEHAADNWSVDEVLSLAARISLERSWDDGSDCGPELRTGQRAQ